MSEGAIIALSVGGYFVLGLGMARFVYVDAYADQYRKMMERYDNRTRAHEEANSWAGGWAWFSIIGWPLMAAIFICFYSGDLFRWLLRINKALDKIHKSVETSSEKRERERLEKEAEKVITSWEPPNA